MASSSVLYRNDEGTVFLIDIPTSIALAQDPPFPSPFLSSRETGSVSQDATAATVPTPRRRIYSTPALTTPFPSPPEPKSDAARARVLARIPESERLFHEEIVPVVQQGLEEIRDSSKKHPAGAGRRMWCLPRKVMQKEEVPDAVFSTEHLTSDDINSGPPTKKLRKSVRMVSDDGSYVTALFDESKGDAISGIDTTDARPGPPLILSPHVNEFSSLSELQNTEVQNPSSKPAVIRVHRDQPGEQSTSQDHITFTIPPESYFVLCTLATPQMSQSRSSHPPIPGLPENKKFSLILFDPPWPNRSVRRAANYATHSPFEMEGLSQMISDIILRHLDSDSFVHPANRPEKDQHRIQPSIVAIWVTNKAKSRTVAYDAIQNAGLSVHEEWIWIKTTAEGEPVTPLQGLWRKPYEVLIIGKWDEKIGDKTPSPPPRRRVIIGVPDVHSRKPNLKELFETVLFSCRSPLSSSSLIADAQRRMIIKYSALEVFARNLTAGWCACGDEVLKFNADEWWVGD
jgi:N6-adenosine-specific RNA methylase IME4